MLPEVPFWKIKKKSTAHLMRMAHDMMLKVSTMRPPSVVAAIGARQELLCIEMLSFLNTCMHQTAWVAGGVLPPSPSRARQAHLQHSRAEWTNDAAQRPDWATSSHWAWDAGDAVTMSGGRTHAVSGRQAWACVCGRRLQLTWTILVLVAQVMTM